MSLSVIDDFPECRKCCFWAMELDSSSMGECRRHAPSWSGALKEWPLTKNSDWCGEFKSEEGI